MEALTKKVGPLPLWAWVAIAVVGYYLYQRYAAAKAASASTTAEQNVLANAYNNVTGAPYAGWSGGASSPGQGASGTSPGSGAGTPGTSAPYGLSTAGVPLAGPPLANGPQNVAPNPPILAWTNPGPNGIQVGVTSATPANSGVRQQLGV